MDSKENSNFISDYLMNKDSILQTYWEDCHPALNLPLQK